MKKILMAGLISVLAVISCNTNSTNMDDNPATVKVKLVDAPALYDAVNIDIQKIEFETASGWNSVSVVTPGVYNLLNFRNGTDVLLASTQLPSGNISQMRLVLGTNNTVVVNGVSYPLTIPSGSQSGLKFNWNQTLEPNGAYDVWIDFDAGRSIVKTGNGKYILKPVIRAFSAVTDGQIKGYVLPQEAKAMVHVITPTNDTVATALPAMDGFYMFRGVPAATYKVSFDADASTGYKDASKDNVTVVYGQVTNLGTTTLTK